MHKKEIFVTKKGYIFSDWKKLPKKCSKDHKLPKKCSKPYVAQKLLERPKVAKKLPSNLCKSLAVCFSIESHVIDKLNNTRILIGSHLLSIGGQMHRWRHHYRQDIKQIDFMWPSVYFAAVLWMSHNVQRRGRRGRECYVTSTDHAHGIMDSFF